MIDDKLKSNNISQHFNSFQEFLDNPIKAIVGGYIPTRYVKKSIIYDPLDQIVDEVYLKNINISDYKKLFQPFNSDTIILNNSESYGSIGLPCSINDYKLVIKKDVIISDNTVTGKNDQSQYARIYPNHNHKCIADLIKHFYEYIYVDGTGYIWTDNINIHKQQFMYERLKINFHEIAGDSYGLLKAMLTAIVDIKNNDINNSFVMLELEELLNKVVQSEMRLLK